MTRTSEIKGNPLVTLFVIAYKQEASVREAIEGAFAQTYQPLQILLSDDASPDGTFEIMQEMAGAYDGPHQVILNRNPENLGLIGHLDRIMEIASGDFVVQNAGDDVSDPRRVEVLARIWQSSERRTLLVYSNARRIDAEGRRIGTRRAMPEILKAPTPANIVRRLGYTLGAACGWDRRLFEVFGPLGPDLEVEDAVLPFRAALLGKIEHVDEELVSHRAGGLASEPEFLSARDVLYGVKLQKIRWVLQNGRYFLKHYTEWDYPGKIEAESVCLSRTQRWEFMVGIAEASRWKRFLFLRKALLLSRQNRSAGPLVYALKYMFEEAYVAYWRLRWGSKGKPQTHLYK